MASKENNLNIKRRKRHRLTLNIGTVIFGAIFVYIIITLILYLSANHITYYQVTSGPLAKNRTYSGLAIRSEQVINADTGGYVYYYAKEYTKVKRYGALFGIGLQKNEGSDISISDSARGEIGEAVRSFSRDFNPIDYNAVSSLKYEISGKLIADAEAIAAEGENSTSTNQSSYSVGDVTVTTSPYDGIVSFITDGYETFDEGSLGPEIFESKSEAKTDLKTDGQINAGDPACKIIDSENWSVYVPLTSKQIIELDGLSSIKVKFLSDGATETASLTIITKEDGSYYGRLDFKNGMIRYANQRFVDIELVTNTNNGLKIPVSSVVTKDFYTIPEEYATTADDSDTEIGFIKETTDSDGQVHNDFITTTLYEHKDGKYYVDEADFTAGDVVMMKNSPGERYVLGDTDSLEGVYCTNKGYAIFRKISIIDKNEEYCIVDTGTKYGISQFDYIVLDASKVKEDQIIAK